MVGMNFRVKWHGWIRECITTTSTLVNGCPTEEFKFGRGLRQGDPLSPFLYLIAAERLNMLTSKAVEIGFIEAPQVGKEKNQISHLQYADDTIFIFSGKGKTSGRSNIS